MSRIPCELLEMVRARLQPRTRNKRRAKVVVVESTERAHLATVDGRTVVKVGKDALCGDYYD